MSLLTPKHMGRTKMERLVLRHQLQAFDSRLLALDSRLLGYRVKHTQPRSPWRNFKAKAKGNKLVRFGGEQRQAASSTSPVGTAPGGAVGASVLALDFTESKPVCLDCVIAVGAQQHGVSTLTAGRCLEACARYKTLPRRGGNHGKQQCPNRLNPSSNADSKRLASIRKGLITLAKNRGP